MSEYSEPATVYTGCFECDHEMEFHGVVNKYDVASFPCPNCGQVFEIANWDSFFDEDDETETEGE